MKTVSFPLLSDADESGTQVRPEDDTSLCLCFLWKHVYGSRGISGGLLHTGT